MKIRYYIIYVYCANMIIIMIPYYSIQTKKKPYNLYDSINYKVSGIHVEYGHESVDSLTNKFVQALSN